MSTTAIVFDPSGTPRDIPSDQLHAAVQAGGIPGVRMQAPDGTVRVIPANRYQEAAQHGGKILPLEDQPKIDMSPEALHANEQELANSYGHAFGFAAGGGMKAVGQVAAESPAIGATVKKVAQTVASRFPQSEVWADLVGMVEPRAAAAMRTLQRGAKLVTKYLPAEEAAAPAAAAASAPKPAPETAPQAAPAEPVQAQPAQPPALGKRAQAKVIKQSNALGPNAQVQQQASTLREIPQLRQQTSDVVDAAVPPTGGTKADNLRAKSQIDFHLSRGDVDSAQQALDKASGKPSFPPEAPKAPGNTHDVRYMQPENQAKRFADAQDDAAVQQNMRANLDAHGKMAESEARKEFIARNSTGVTKEDLVNAAGGEMNGPTRYRGDEPVSKPKKVPQPKPMEAVQADIETQAMLMQRAGANPGAIERMKAIRMGDYQNQVKAFRTQGGTMPSEDLTNVLQKSVDQAKKEVRNPIPPSSQDIATDAELDALGKAKRENDFSEKSVPVDSLTTRQAKLEKAVLDRAAQSKGIPEVYKQADGKYVVLDGNHRAAAALLRGERMIKVRIWNVR